MQPHLHKSRDQLPHPIVIIPGHQSTHLFKYMQSPISAFKWEVYGQGQIWTL